MKAENKIGAPTIAYRPAKPYIGIRTVTPFAGMFAVVTTHMKTLRQWVNQHQIAEQGPFFLRYYQIDMQGLMDIEVGFKVTAPVPGDERIKPGLLPAGRYASLVYSGNGLKGNKALLDWAKTNNITLDRWAEPAGDTFACRYEAYLTDYRVEPRKLLWEIDLAIKIADA
ncbi:MAG: hypothetical protein DYG89_09065 [Caldilinea sp. CFX5]|nr:hypothetical protein [Caldilinea sp. CFX5]